VTIKQPASPAGDAAPASRRSELQVFLLFLRWLLPLWHQSLLVLLLSVLVATLNVVPPWLIRFFVDVAVKDHDWNVFLAVFAGLVGLETIRHGVTQVSRLMSLYVDLCVNRRIRRHFFSHLQRLSMTFIQDRPIGEHMYRASADIDAVMRMVTDILPDALRAIYEFCLILTFTTLLSPSVTVIILLYSIPYAAITHWVATRVRKADRVTRARWQERDADLQEGIAGVATVKAFGRRRNAVGRQIRRTVAGYRAALHQFYVQSMTQAHLVNGLLPYIKGLLVRIYFLHQVIEGKLTYGSVFPINDYMNRLTNPIQQMVDYFQQVRIAMIPAERILETMDVAPQVTDRSGAARMPVLRGEIEFDRVRFRYEDGRQVLDGLSFHIPAGRRIAIVGTSGAGKSTVASLLLRLYDPAEGSVRVDGRDLREVRARSYQDQLGLVLQETYLFRGTVRENLLFSHPGATTAQLVEAAQLADVHDFILSLPDGYDQDLGEGTKLSLSQRQRLGIARALLRDPRILILDEPTSSLDSRSEQTVLDTLRKAAAGRTTILITHRLNTAADADEIWVMDRGRIVERGSHFELLALGGTYHRLHALYYGRQSGGAEPRLPMVEAA
jgi:ABC-type multidrug transport system fused ATPase/permease subunit